MFRFEEKAVLCCVQQHMRQKRKSKRNEGEAEKEWTALLLVCGQRAVTM